MPRYIVERSFPEGFELPFGQAGIDVCRGVVGINEDLGVTWIHSYVRDDRLSTFCVYEAPNPESIRRAAARNRLPDRPHHPGDPPRPVLLHPLERGGA